MNENRLSPSGVESGLVELRSRDTVQFGVNVNVEKGARARSHMLGAKPLSLKLASFTSS